MTLVDLIAELEALLDRAPLDRVRAARLLSDQALAAIAAVGDQAVWECTRPRGPLTRADAAAALGVSVGAVAKAIGLHNARQKALTVRADSDAGRPTKRAKTA